MEMHQIRYFLAACETLNFSRAADRCQVSAPSLSRSIRSLEEELGGQLFRRERHLTHLTDLGRLMQRDLAQAQQATESALREAENYSRLAGTRLKLGVCASIGAETLTGYLATLRQRAPDLELHVWEADCERIEAALLGAEIDVALSSAPRVDDRIRKTELFVERYHVAFAPGHRFEAMDGVPLPALEGETFIKHVHCEFASNLALLGMADCPDTTCVRYVGERDDWIQAMVRAGLGCTLMPEHLPLLDGILTRPLIEPEVSRTVSLITVAGRPHSRPAEVAIAVACHHVWTARVPAKGKLSQHRAA